MKLTIAEHKLLKDSISIISDLVSEARINVKKDMLEIAAMDPANVAMIDFKMLSSCFTEYNTPKEDTISLNLNNFKQVLKRLSSEDVLHLELENNKLKITLQGKSTRTFYLPLIDLEEKAQKVPNLTFKASIEMPSKMFSGIVDDVALTAESMMLNATKAKVLFSGEGDNSKAEVEIDPTNQEVKVFIEEESKAKYSIEYLKKLAEGQKLADTVKIELGKDYPLRLSFNLLNQISMRYILAPRVDND